MPFVHAPAPDSRSSDEMNNNSSSAILPLETTTTVVYTPPPVVKSDSGPTSASDYATRITKRSRL